MVVLQPDENNFLGTTGMMQNFLFFVVGSAAIAFAVHPPEARAQSEALNSTITAMRGYFELDEYGRALTAAERAHQLAEHELRHDQPLLAEIKTALADLYSWHQFFEKAVPLYQQALSIREIYIGPDDPSVATILNNLALVYKTRKQFKEAKPLAERALAIKEAALGPEDPALAPTLEIYGAILRHEGRDQEAEEILARAKAIREKSQEP